MAQALGERRARAWYRRMALRSVLVCWTGRPLVDNAIPRRES